MKRIYLLAVILVLMQCSEDDVKKKTCRLVKQRYAELSYDGNGTLITITQLQDNGDPTPGGYRREFEYNSNGELITIDEFQGTFLDRIFTFEYGAGQIVQKEYWFPRDNDDESVDYTVIYSLNDEGKVFQLDHESWNLSEPFSHVYEYENGNVVKVNRTSESGTNNYVQEFEFDAYLNPDALAGFELYFSDNIFSNITQNRNNPTKTTLTITGTSPIINTYAYSYNNNNYPTERFNNGSSTANWFFEYECK